MELFKFCVFTVLVVADFDNTFANFVNKHGKVSMVCTERLISKCPKKMFEDKTCLKLWRTLQLEVTNTDTNNDCKVDVDDVEKYYRTLDSNGDKAIESGEFGIAYNDIYYLQDKTIDHLYKIRFGKSASIEDYKEKLVSQFKKVRHPLPQDKKTFLDEHLLRELVNFCNDSSMMRTNSDCWELLSFCQKKKLDYMACNDFIYDGTFGKLRSLRDMLRFETTLADTDKDGVISYKEAVEFIKSSITKDNSTSCINETQWINWNIEVGHTLEFARALYKNIDDLNKPGCLDENDLKYPINGESVEHRWAQVLGFINKTCQESSFYGVNRACVDIPYVCNYNIMNEPFCKPYVNSQCDLETTLKDCINDTLAPGKECSKSSADIFEAKFQISKMTGCKSIPDNSAINQANPLLLLTSLLLLLIRT